MNRFLDGHSEVSLHLIHCTQIRWHTPLLPPTLQNQLDSEDELLPLGHQISSATNLGGPRVFPQVRSVSFFLKLRLVLKDLCETSILVASIRVTIRNFR